ncbi:MAG: zinc-ribbon domain-containing protein, partial [Gemmatimonadaceae bacterium]
MLVQCSSCLTEFELDPAKVPAAGVRARCSVCSAVISVPAPRVEAKPAEVELPAHEQVATELPAAETAPAPKPAAESQRTQPEPQHAASPVAAETESSHVSASTAQPPSVPAEAPAPPEPAPQEPATPAPVAAASESWEHRADTGADRTWGARTATESAH